MFKAQQGVQDDPRLSRGFSPSPVSTTLFHKAPALFDHHPSAHLPDVKEPCLPFTTSRFGVQFHSQNNHDGLFWKVSLTFIKHGDPDLSLLPPPYLRVDICKGYNPSIQSIVEYFYSLLLTDWKHSTFSYMNLKCAQSHRQGCQYMDEPWAASSGARAHINNQSHSVVPSWSQTRLPNPSPGSPGSHHPSDRAVIWDEIYLPSLGSLKSDEDSKITYYVQQRTVPICIKVSTS